MKRLVTLIEGDGIGPEVARSVKAIFAAAKVPIEFETVDPHGPPTPSSASQLPQKLVESVKKNRVALKGPLTTPIGKGIRSLNLEIRKTFDLYANVRPCKTIPGLEMIYGDVDVVTIRENSEGEYSGIEHMIKDNIAQSVKVITRTASENIARFAFNYAIENRRNTVTVCHKANIMRKSDGMFLNAARSVAEKFRGKINFVEDRIDTACLRLVMKPSSYDVMLMPNLYGDIVSDLCSGLIGGLGLTASGNFGDKIAVFEAVHGSAPDIAGNDQANPTALVLSSVMMLRHLKLYECASAIEKAVHLTLKNPKHRTKDLGGPLKCSEFTNELIKSLK